MDNLFLVQLTVAFFIGGAITTLQIFAAEKASEKMSGLILGLPTTPVVSLFFIGLVLSPTEVAKSLSVSPAILGSLLIVVPTYLYISRIKTDKNLSIAFSTIAALIVWLAMALPIAQHNGISWFWSFALYLPAFMLSFYLLSVKPSEVKIKKNLDYSWKEMIARFTFTGSVILVSVVLSKTLGPVWGAVFSFFPAKFLSTFITLHWFYDSDFLFKTCRNTPIGTIYPLSYVVAASFTYPKYGLYLGTFIAYAFCILVFFTVLFIMDLTRAKALTSST